MNLFHVVEIIDKDIKQIDKERFDLGHLECFTQADLKKIIQKLDHKELQSNKIKLSITGHPFFLRLKMRVLFLLGNRDDALTLAKKSLTKVFQKKWNRDPVGEMFIAESFQIFNRTSHFNLVKDNFENLKDRQCKIITELLRVEYYVAHIEDDLELAKSGLNKIALITKHLSGEYIDIGKQKRIDELKAYTHFQLARIYYANKNYAQALSHYSIAKQSFSNLNMMYFATFTHHNIVWLHFYCRDWENFNKEYDLCFKLASEFNYNYILSGLHHMKSEFYKKELKYQSSLEEIELSLDNLSKAGKVAQKFDTLLFKSDIHLAIGDYKNTRKALKDIQSLGITSNKYIKKHNRWCTYLKVLTQKTKMTSEQESMINEHPAYFIRTFEINQKRGFESSFIKEALNNSILEGPEFNLFQSEINLLKAIELKEDSIALNYIHKMKSELEKCDVELVQKFALELLEDLLKKDIKSKTYYIKKLKSVACYESFKDSFLAVIDCVFDREKSLFSHSKWNQSSFYENKRWVRWFSRFLQVQEKALIIESTDSVADIVYDEINSKISIKNKEIIKLQKRDQLKRLLKIFLQNSERILSKKEISEFVWEENYHPEIHDPRLYTAINRLKTILDIDNVFIKVSAEYKFNLDYSFKLIVNKNQGHQRTNKVQGQILNSLRKYHSNQREWVGKSDIKKDVDASDATIKRELKNLIDASILIRKGHSRNIRYSMITAV